jgi:hypothetical protein
MRLRFALAVGVAALGFTLFARRAAFRQGLFDLTGEEQLPGQLRGVGQLALDLLRPRLDLQPAIPIAHNGVNPFGLNTFLQHEVEPAKREQQVRLISDAGFHWLRQEFPWSDIEISGQGQFEDCRNASPDGDLRPCISAWDKYDQIVDLADAYGLEIIARLSSPPDWSRADGAARGAFAPPDRFTDFADFAATLAERYRGRIHHYQVWNEPNGNDEWGYQPVDPEAYTRLLCQTYRRLKAVDPNIVVLAAALTPTNELGGPNPNGLGGNNLNDFVFLQRMYNAGARECFDVMSVQGYGLFSGPSDRRLDPININYGRNQFMRDIMVANGDAHKAIWISEMNWNAAPNDVNGAGTYGQVTEEQQARYAVRAYQRAQAEWPWVGVNTFWFFKRADDSEKNQAWYYFRMADPDFSLRPVYYAIQAYTHQTPVMYPGWYQEDHWAVQWSEGWETVANPGSTLNAYRVSAQSGASLRFTFSGTDLTLVTYRGPTAGQVSVSIDHGPSRTYAQYDQIAEPQSQLGIARHLHAGQHTVEIMNLSGPLVVDGFIVRRTPDHTMAVLGVLMVVFGLLWYAARRGQSEPPST